MLKKISNLGSTLSKTEQKSISGGGRLICCEWCSYGCLDWTTPGVTCPFSAGC